MTEIVNLNQARKLREKAKKRAQADENTVKFGRTKAQRLREEIEAAKARSALDGTKRSKPEPPEDTP